MDAVTVTSYVLSTVSVYGSAEKTKGSELIELMLTSTPSSSTVHVYVTGAAAVQLDKAPVERIDRDEEAYIVLYFAPMIVRCGTVALLETMTLTVDDELIPKKFSSLSVKV